MNSKYDYDIIRDYLHGLVDQETARRIRDLIREDEVARNIAAGILQLEHEFNGREEEIESYIEGLRLKQLTLINVQGRSRHIRAWMKIAATILIIAVAGSVVWLTIGKSDLVEDELRNPYPLTVADRGNNEVNKGFEFYQKGEYRKAIASFGQEADDVSTIFYNGLSNLYAGEYEKAVALLGTLSLKESRYKEQAEWYRAIGLLKAGREEEAKASLEKIRDQSQHYKSTAAEKILGSP
ncbi:MAG TPA: hypothetical protein VFE50_20640 [Cyclobacteriaceae bacterium]|nr:hypothetical protein [Cyclobacteriaceae bacterium]